MPASPQDMADRQAATDYERIARAIQYIHTHVRDQPGLDELAAQVHLSPFHFQRLFNRWAGTAPKRFLQIQTLELGKALLTESSSLLAVSDAMGLGSASRLHDHFVSLEAMTPGEYRNRGLGVTGVYGHHDSPFGRVFVAQTPRGVCRVAFMDAEGELQDQLAALKKAWPLAVFHADDDAVKPVADRLSAAPNERVGPLSLHVSGTNFQLAVWRALLRIPAGQAVSYGQMAQAVGSPRAVRATGTAVGANPVAFFIPCHRVIQQSGALGGYRWGLTRKLAMQTWERLQQPPATWA